MIFFPSPGPASVYPVRLLSTLGALTTLLLAVAPQGVTGQAPPPPPPPPVVDSTALRAEVEELQSAYESFRERSMPAPIRVWDGSCDLRVGRMCMRHDRGEEAGAPPEPPPVALARSQLLTELGEIANQIPGDGWILGHRILYQLESGAMAQAESLARSCNLAPDDAWWCSALLGLILHRQGKTDEATTVFRGALRAMPVAEARRWTAARFLLDGDGRSLMEAASDDERERLERRVWLMADPLYMVPGNDRQVEQYARFVVRKIRETGNNPYDIPWDADLEELLIRYGQEIGWERARSTSMPSGLQDGRSVIGRQVPGGVEYLPDGAWLDDPSTIPTGVWFPEAWVPRSSYRAPYARTVIPLESQVARFRRGDSLLVVTAFAPAAEAGPRRPATVSRRRDRGIIVGERRTPERSDPFGSVSGFGVEAPDSGPEEEADPRGSTTAPFAFFAVPLGGEGEEDGEPREILDGTGTLGAYQVMLPNGRYLLSMEAWDQEESKMWRARQGVAQRSILPDIPTVSDLVILTAEAPDAELAGSLDEALPRVRPGTRLFPGETVAVAWEIYGLRPEEPVALTLGLDRGEGGLLQRAGEFLRIVQPEAPITLGFEETAPGGGILGRAFRSVNLTLPETLEPGEYVLSLEVQLSGRSPITTERRFVVEAAPANE